MKGLNKIPSQNDQLDQSEITLLSLRTRLHAVPHREEVGDVVDVVGVVDVHDAQLASPRLGHAHQGDGRLAQTYVCKLVYQYPRVEANFSVARV